MLYSMMVCTYKREFLFPDIAGQAGYDKIWEYMENDPSKWEEDIFFKN